MRSVPIVPLMMMLVVVAASVFCAASCAGLTPLEVEEYLSAVPAQLPDLSTVADGTYSGAYRIRPPSGEIAFLQNVAVVVDVFRHSLSCVSVESPAALVDDPEFAAYAQRIVSAGSLDVDGVTGATYSSKAFAKAIEIALTPPYQKSMTEVSQ